MNETCTSVYKTWWVENLFYHKDSIVLYTQCYSFLSSCTKKRKLRNKNVFKHVKGIGAAKAIFVAISCNSVCGFGSHPQWHDYIHVEDHGWLQQKFEFTLSFNHFLICCTSHYVKCLQQIPFNTSYNLYHKPSYLLSSLYPFPVKL